MPPKRCSRKPASARRQPAAAALTKTSSAKPSSTSSKRRKPDCEPPVMTPFRSILTDRPYEYDRKAAETQSALQCLPCHPELVMPKHTGSTLNTIVSVFSKEVHDIIVSPSGFLIIILTLNPDNLEPYMRLLTPPGRVPISGSKYAFHISPNFTLEELLQPFVPESRIDVDESAMEDSDDFSDASEDSSLAMSEEDFNPTPPWQRTSAVLPESAATRPQAELSSTSAPAAANGVLSSTITQETAPSMPEIPQPPPPKEPSLPTDQPAASAPRGKPSIPLSDEKRRGRARFKTVDFSKVTVEVPPTPAFLTLIFRPTTVGTSLRTLNPRQLNRALLELGGEVHTVRDIRDGGIAVDFPPDTVPGRLLTATTLLNTPVRASHPAAKTGVSGVATGIHPDTTDAEIRADSRVEPPTEITSVKRLAKPGQPSWTVKLTFASDVLPDRIFLDGRCHRLRPYNDRPLQCFRCGRYGHPARVCRSDLRCWTCGDPHETKYCTNKDAPKCSACDGDHSADSPACPTRNFQVKVCEVKATNKTTYKVARQAVSKAARSYAAAVKGPNKEPTAPRVQPVPEPTAPAFIPNTAHARPPPEPVTANILASLFQGLVAILTAAATNGDINAALQKTAELFRTLTPGSTPDSFQIV